MIHRIQVFISSFILVVLTSLVVSCSPPAPHAFQKQVAVPGAKWDYAFQPEFTFDVPDTSSKYKVFLIFRYDAAFEFSNIWVKVKERAPEAKNFEMGHRIEAVLIAPDGSRLGNNMGGVYEYKIQLREGIDFPKFSKPGKYSIQLEQIMRSNPLVGFLNIGLRVERSNIKQPVS